LKNSLKIEIKEQSITILKNQCSDIELIFNLLKHIAKFTSFAVYSIYTITTGKKNEIVKQKKNSLKSIKDGDVFDFVETILTENENFYTNSGENYSKEIIG